MLQDCCCQQEGGVGHAHTGGRRAANVGRCVSPRQRCLGRAAWRAPMHSRAARPLLRRRSRMQQRQQQQQAWIGAARCASSRRSPRCCLHMRRRRSQPPTCCNLAADAAWPARRRAVHVVACCAACGECWHCSQALERLLSVCARVRQHWLAGSTLQMIALTTMLTDWRRACVVVCVLFVCCLACTLPGAMMSARARAPSTHAVVLCCMRTHMHTQLPRALLCCAASSCIVVCAASAAQLRCWARQPVLHLTIRLPILFTTSRHAARTGLEGGATDARSQAPASQTLAHMPAAALLRRHDTPLTTAREHTRVCQRHAHMPACRLSSHDDAVVPCSWTAVCPHSPHHHAAAAGQQPTAPQEGCAGRGVMKAASRHA